MINDGFVGPASSLHELCSHEGRDFIRSAYLTVLGRLPDADGFEFYRSRLNQGVSKLTILHQLRASEEARRHDPGIAGFDRALKRHRHGNIPLIGWTYRMLTKGESESPAARERRALLRRIEGVEARLLAIHADLAERLEEKVFPRGPRRNFGIMPAGQHSAQPWAASTSA
jgi:hypothetical protein